MTRLPIDAGGIGFYGTPQDQAKIKDLLISHTHADHIASLPIFIENVYEGGPEPVAVHGSSHVLEALQTRRLQRADLAGLYRDVSHAGPFLRLNQIESGRPIELAGAPDHPGRGRSPRPDSRLRD